MQSTQPLVLALPAAARVGTFTKGCRAAALDFVNRVSAPPGALAASAGRPREAGADDTERGAEAKRELAEWLRGPYHDHVFAVALVTARPPTSLGLGSPLGARSGSPASVPAIAAGALQRVLAKARYEALIAFARARDPEDGVSLAFSALSAGLVSRCQDADGTPGWVPVCQPRMRLAERVLSLIAADYLLRADDYEAALFTCSLCGRVCFDAEGKGRGGICEAHEKASVRRSEVREILGRPPASGLRAADCGPETPEGRSR
jgi:hypothetical protein